MKRKFFVFLFIFGIMGCFTYCQTLNDKKQDTTEQIEKKETDIQNPINKEADWRLEFVNAAMQYLGTPYKYASSNKKGMDCSGLVYRSAFDAFAYELPRSAKAIANAVKKINEDESPQMGDLLFFNTTGSGISHVGIYIDDNKFIHSASAGPRLGVIISSLEEKYWKKRFLFYGEVDFIAE